MSDRAFRTFLAASALIAALALAYFAACQRYQLDQGVIIDAATGRAYYMDGERIN